MAFTSAQPGHGRAIARRSPPGCLKAGVYVLGWLCWGCEGHFPGCCPSSHELILLCLPVHGAMGQVPVPCPVPGDVQISSTDAWAGSPYSCPNQHALARGEELGSLPVPRVCWEGKHACSWGTGGGTRGGAVAKEHHATMQHPVWALHSHSLPHGTGWDHADRTAAHLSRHEGSASCHGGAAGCHGVTQPGWHAVLAGLRACCDSLVP